MTDTDGTPNSYLILLTYSSGTSSHNLSPLKGWPCQARYEDAAPPLSYSVSGAHLTQPTPLVVVHMSTRTCTRIQALICLFYMLPTCTCCKAQIKCL